MCTLIMSIMSILNPMMSIQDQARLGAECAAYPEFGMDKGWYLISAYDGPPIPEGPLVKE